MSKQSDLVVTHAPEAISQRLASKQQQQYVSDAILGGIDGCVTTFAVVSSAVGAGLSATVALIMGFANLLADGFSMAVSNYESVRAQHDYRDNIARIEELHIYHVPDGEREEIRQIFEKKGFSGDVLSTLVQTICADRQLWVDTMLAEEYGLSKSERNPWWSAVSTLCAFLVVGAVPLLPFFMFELTQQDQYVISSTLAGLMFLSIGMIKAQIFDQKILLSGIKTLLTGGVAATLAYLTGYFLRRFFDV